MTGSESRVKHGLLWLGTAGAALRGIDLVSSLAVLWLLTREQMGLASLSWAVAIIVEAFNGLGVGTALVQAEHVGDDEVDSLFWFTLGVGSLLAGGVALASPILARALGAPALAGMIAISALRSLFMAGALVPLQLLQRRLEFRKIAAVQTLAAGLAALLKIGLAALGFGAWALVLAHTGEGLLTLLTLAWISPYWPKRGFSYAKVARFVRFGLKAASSTIIYQGYRNLDFVIVGRVFGVDVLGAYRVAFDVAMVPAMAILDVVNRTAFPVYSRIGAAEREQLERVFLWMVRHLALVTGPLVVLSFFVGPDVLVLVSGSKWLPAAPLIRVLCWAAFLRTLSQATPQLFHAAGRPELAAYDSLLTLVCFVGSAAGALLILKTGFGANAVSLAWVLTYSITVPVLRRMARSVISLSARAYFGNLARPAALMVLLFAALQVAQRMLGGAPRVLAVAAELAVGLAVSAAYFRSALGLRMTDVLPRPGDLNPPKF